MDAAAEIGRNLVSKHQIQSGYREWAGWRGTGRLNPFRETIYSQARSTGTGENSFSPFSWPRAGLATLPGWSILCYNMWWRYIIYILGYYNMVFFLPCDHGLDFWHQLIMWEFNPSFRRFCFCLYFLFLLSLELCRCSSDLFLSSRPRTGLATTYITGYVWFFFCFVFLM